MLCESVDHDGSLRFSEQIPYSEEMLATITDTNVDIVRSAIKIFSQLNMVEIMDDGTYFMSQVESMIGSETYWADRKRLQRQNKMMMLDNVQQESNDNPTCPSKSKSKSKSKSNNNTSSSIEAEFEHLWSIYPKKQGKKRAFEAYKRARKKGVASEDVEAGIRAYLKHIEMSKTDFQYIKQGSTYFAQEAWTDSYPGRGWSDR